MERNFTKQLRQNLKLTFFAGAGAGITVFAWIRTILYEIPFSLKEDGVILLRVILTGWILMTLLRLSIYGLCYFADRLETISFQKLFSGASLTPALSILLISIFFMACKLKTTGITKELDTGLVTKYSGLKPERTRIVMNNETLTHNDIPIGESFKIINEGVSGFDSKDGKVFVTCSLEIKDMKGNVLLSAPDLFEGKNVFSKDSVSVLSATVNTGKPMEWEEKYEVKAVFKDNYGSGTIENKITIRAIDIP
ncbi:hypothetical protein [Pollutibacter soli]|uniref:hypothetical protein n=1 Tax=Pollutibacter soli TaxID=3034157 RepID=UPI00301363EF